MPSRLHRYMKSIASIKYGTLQAMHAEMLNAFLLEKPWLTAGIRWRETRGLTGKGGERSGFLRDSEVTGWEQVNFVIPPKLYASVEALAAEQGVSTSSVFYTASYWWVWFVFPPAHEVKAREEAGLPLRVEGVDQHVTP
jgi:hypothetical protein